MSGVQLERRGLEKTRARWRGGQCRAHRAGPYRAGSRVLNLPALCDGVCAAGLRPLAAGGVHTPGRHRSGVRTPPVPRGGYAHDMPGHSTGERLVRGNRGGRDKGEERGGEGKGLKIIRVLEVHDVQSGSSSGVGSGRSPKTARKRPVALIVEQGLLRSGKPLSSLTCRALNRGALRDSWLRATCRSAPTEQSYILLYMAYDVILYST
ncbi:hypothetical protein BD414DRAFT_252323 [Trametes punicea]|nr:hypothetical protein BD414DRAFT_252323 [Trametes punicea]